MKGESLKMGEEKKEKRIRMSKERWEKGLERQRRVEEGRESEGSHCLPGSLLILN